ncbi:MAG: redoxin domain-containing protein [Candidatus Promineifilaceae bacterium]|nr:redoxin domain-containing protein [Candidatus Promineifilaceae bacterium]
MDAQIVRMAEFADGRWLNTRHALRKQDLRGQVTLIDFWDFSCVNCLRTLPYLRLWHDRYGHNGLRIVGVHAPEFRFGRSAKQLRSFVIENDLRYPILLDNDFETWDRFAVKAWPTKFLVDSRGYIRLRRQGEGYYREIELAIQRLLRQQQEGVSLPDPLPALRAQDRPGAICYRPTPELHAGYAGGGLFGGALGNAEGYVTESIMAYSLPEADERLIGQFYLEGFWRTGKETVSYAGQDGGRVMVPYRAAGVNAVLSPTSDPVELDLNLGNNVGAIVEVRQDGTRLARDRWGTDLKADSAGNAVVAIDSPGLYRLVRNPGHERHELELIFHASDLALYTFSFETCRAPAGEEDQSTTFKRP